MDNVRREKERQRKRKKERGGEREKVKCHEMFRDKKRMKGLIHSFY
jgi:hypothetical protein